MYEPYSKQCLPSKEYRALLGAALCVFNSNNSFIIENILRAKGEIALSWRKLIDKTSGELQKDTKLTITKNSNTNIARLFEIIIQKRNRIVHSFKITAQNEMELLDNDRQILATKTKTDEQFIIDKNYLLEFIKENEKLSDMLHEFRGF